MYGALWRVLPGPWWMRTLILVALAAAVLLGACGGGGSSEADEPEGNFHVKVTEAAFPSEQALGQTSLLKLAIRNTGKSAASALLVVLHP